ncbi:hypothetical protein PSPO01_14512 [Paraphaeosphaeria sporulosa]
MKNPSRDSLPPATLSPPTTATGARGTKRQMPTRSPLDHWPTALIYGKSMSPPNMPITRGHGIR